MTAETTTDTMRLQYEVERFLSEEAGLLEERRFSEWFDLTTDDITYTMPVRVTRMQRDHAMQFLPIERAGHFNDNKHTLGVRVKKLLDPKSWSENPVSLPRVYITNVRVRETEVEDEFLAISNMLFTRTRLDQTYPPIAARREDLLRRASNAYGFSLARRTIYIDHATLPGTGINTIL